ncbi:hypothetical protein BH23PAT2_BH23PAT2_04080 [soil metagenome]
MAKKHIKKSTTSSKATTRKISQRRYASFRLQKRVKHPGNLAKTRRILSSAHRHVWQHKRLFFGIVLVYAILTVVLVSGFGLVSELEDIRAIIDELIEGQFGQIASGAAVLSLLISNTVSAPTEVASLYQTILFVLVSLAIIWSLRQTYAKESPALRDAFYLGMYPVIPFIFVLVIIGLQLVPFAIGSWLFTTVTTGGLAVTFVEQLLWLTLFFLLTVLSLYMISSSLFALYIVTLPDMRPMQALKSARELVRFRRWTVLRKVLFLPFALSIIGLIVLLPMAIFTVPIAIVVTILLYSLLCVLYAHAYMYELYRELL